MPALAFALAGLAEVLVLTHPMASLDETMPYHNCRFFPVPVLEMFGRSWSELPRAGKHEVVFAFWKDFPSCSLL